MFEKKKILFDMNIDGDCTNLGSLAVLNILCNAGEADILATTASYQSPLATGCIKAVNRFYGNYDIPVGILHCQKETNVSSFPAYINQVFCPEYPYGEEAEDTVTVMRRALSEQEDDSVVLVVAGCFASVASLMKSEPDEISNLSGQELCDKKISRLIAMAGSFNTFGDGIFSENNVRVQIPAAKYVTEHWTKEFILSGFEIGWRVRTMREFRFYGDDNNPLKPIYNINDAAICNFSEDNPSWDHTAVIEGVRPGLYFNYHEYGRIFITDEGLTEWYPQKEGKMTYLIPKEPLEKVSAVINDLVFPEWRQYKIDKLNPYKR